MYLWTNNPCYKFAFFHHVAPSHSVLSGRNIFVWNLVLNLARAKNSDKRESQIRTPDVKFSVSDYNATSEQCATRSRLVYADCFFSRISSRVCYICARRSVPCKWFIFLMNDLIVVFWHPGTRFPKIRVILSSLELLLIRDIRIRITWEPFTVGFLRVGKTDLCEDGTFGKYYSAQVWARTLYRGNPEQGKCRIRK